MLSRILAKTLILPILSYHTKAEQRSHGKEKSLGNFKIVNFTRGIRLWVCKDHHIHHRARPLFSQSMVWNSVSTQLFHCEVKWHEALGLFPQFSFQLWFALLGFVTVSLHFGRWILPVTVHLYEYIKLTLITESLITEYLWLAISNFLA